MLVYEILFTKLFTDRRGCANIIPFGSRRSAPTTVRENAPRGMRSGYDGGVTDYTAGCTSPCLRQRPDGVPAQPLPLPSKPALAAVPERGLVREHGEDAGDAHGPHVAQDIHHGGHDDAVEDVVH